MATIFTAWPAWRSSAEQLRRVDGRNGAGHAEQHVSHALIPDTAVREHSARRRAVSRVQRSRSLGAEPEGAHSVAPSSVFATIQSAAECCRERSAMASRFSLGYADFQLEFHENAAKIPSPANFIHQFRRACQANHNSASSLLTFGAERSTIDGVVPTWVSSADRPHRNGLLPRVHKCLRRGNR